MSRRRGDPGEQPYRQQSEVGSAQAGGGVGTEGNALRLGVGPEFDLAGMYRS